MNATPAKGLGKGLSALMGEEYSQVAPNEGGAQEGSSASASQSGPNSISLDAIHAGAFQPRVRFNEKYLEELADSIRKNGVMQPIVVRPSSRGEGQYEIVAGERRWRASKLANMNEIPAIVRDLDDQVALELALVENIQRQDLSPLEEAAGYQRLMKEFGYKQDELAKTVGKSRSHVANLLRLLSLPDKVKTYLDKGELSMGHGRALLNAEDPVQLAKNIVKEGLTVRQVEKMVKGKIPNQFEETPIASRPSSSTSSSRPSTPQTNKDKDADIIALEETLSDSLGLGVSINDNGGQSGEVILHYSSLAELDEILRRLGGGI